MNDLQKWFNNHKTGLAIGALGGLVYTMTLQQAGASLQFAMQSISISPVLNSLKSAGVGITNLALTQVGISSIVIFSMIGALAEDILRGGRK